MACSTMLEFWGLMLVAIGFGEKVHVKKLVDKSAPLVIGSTEEEVVDLLGQPTIKWERRRGVSRFIFGERPTLWIYGTTLDLQFVIVPGLANPNPIPIKLRFLKPDAEDLVIYWSPHQTVADVTRPQIDIPDRITEAYESLDFIADLVRVLSPGKRR